MSEQELRQALRDELEGNYEATEIAAVEKLIFSRPVPGDVKELQEKLREEARLFVWTAQYWGERE